MNCAGSGLRITFFRNFELEKAYETVLAENSKLREKLGIRDRQLSDRVDDLHGPKADRIPTDSVQSDELDLSSDDVLGSLTDLIKNRIRKDLSKFDYDCGWDSADGGHKENDSNHQFKTDITDVVIRIDPGQFCMESGCEGGKLEHFSDDGHRILWENPTLITGRRLVEANSSVPVAGKFMRSLNRLPLSKR